MLKDLDELVSAGIITSDQANKILHHYETRNGKQGSKFTIVLSILGALLVGSGIILLVAHNWDQMSMTLKSIFAFFPLALGQLLCVLTLVKRKGDITWRESSAVILFFATASCMALVSQIYHITGTIEGFIMRWLLMTAPLIYIMRSSMVSLLVIACATWYAMLKGYSHASYSDLPYFYPGCMLFILPHYWRYLKSSRGSNFFHLHNWFFVFSTLLCLATFVIDPGNRYEFIFIGYCFLLGIYYLLGTSHFFNGRKLFANPFLLAGVVGLIIILLIWSYDQLWNDPYDNRPGPSGLMETSFVYISVVLLIIHAWLLTALDKSRNALTDPLRLTPYVFTALVLFFSQMPIIGLFVINGWILLLGLFYIRKGTKSDHLGILNFGLLIIASLALLRFFDNSIGFVWRGLFFVATGVGFFLANYLLLKKRKSLT